MMDFDGNQESDRIRMRAHPAKVRRRFFTLAEEDAVVLGIWGRSREFACALMEHPN